MSEYEMPMLSVAENKYGEYVHIRDINEERKNEVFKCPICGGKVKARSIKKENKMQPHFYHVDGSCSKESISHWVYKNWLLKEGTEFDTICKDKIQHNVVKNIDIEKTFDTKFGKYRPDITVTTTDERTIYFEVKYNSGKTKDDYFSKWQELENDVVEIDIKKMINADYNGEILQFNVIYSDNVCHLNNYKGRDYDFCNKKYEIKRQDKLNYKARVELLDWMWKDFTEYMKNQSDHNKENVIISFSELILEDKEFVFDFIKKHKLSDLKEDLEKILDNEKYGDIWHLIEKVNGIGVDVNLSKGKKLFKLSIENRKTAYNIDDFKKINKILHATISKYKELKEDNNRFDKIKKDFFDYYIDINGIDVSLYSSAKIEFHFGNIPLIYGKYILKVSTCDIWSERYYYIDVMKDTYENLIEFIDGYIGECQIINNDSLIYENIFNMKSCMEMFCRDYGSFEISKDENDWYCINMSIGLLNSLLDSEIIEYEEYYNLYNAKIKMFKLKGNVFLISIFNDYKFYLNNGYDSNFVKTGTSCNVLYNYDRDKYKLFIDEKIKYYITILQDVLNKKLLINSNIRFLEKTI